MMWWISLGVGALTGIISGFGIGGGSLLVLYLTMVAGFEQRVAGGINLLYFMACAPTALIGHIKNKLVDARVFIWTAAAGCAASLIGSWVAHAVDVSLLRQGFGLLLIYIGIKELLYRKVDEPTETPYNNTHHR